MGAEEAHQEPGHYEEFLRYLRDIAVVIRDRPMGGMLSPQWVIDGVTHQLEEKYEDWAASG